MACPQPYKTSERVSVVAEAQHRDEQRAQLAARVVKLHLDNVTNTVIARRLSLPVPSVVKYLREGGYSGNSAKSEE